MTSAQLMCESRAERYVEEATVFKELNSSLTAYKEPQTMSVPIKEDYITHPFGVFVRYTEASCAMLNIHASTAWFVNIVIISQC
jgi:hypothetical protein